MANTFNDGVASSNASTTMLLSEARTSVQKSMLDNNTSYGYEDVDRALLYVLEDFMEVVKPVVTSGTIATTGTSPFIDVQTNISRLRPDRMIRCELHKFNESQSGEPGHKVEQVDYDAIARAIRSGSAAGTSGMPSKIAFRTENEAFLDQCPGTTYPVIRFTYYDTLDRWTPGTATNGASQSINIPINYLGMPIWYGATAMLQHTDPAAAYGSKAWNTYVDYRERCKGRCGFNSHILVMDENIYI